MRSRSQEVMATNIEPQRRVCCQRCAALASRELQEVFAQAAYDHRVSSLVVLIVQRAIDRLLPHRQTCGQSQVMQTIEFTSNDNERLTDLFGSADACKALHQGSRYWAVLVAVSSCLRRSGVAVCFSALDAAQQDSQQRDARADIASDASIAQQEGMQEACCTSVVLQHAMVPGVSQQDSREQGACCNQERLAEDDRSTHTPRPSATSLSEAVSSAACSLCCSGSLLVLQLSWFPHQRPSVARSCGALLLSWFPQHATAVSQPQQQRLGCSFSLASLEARSQAAKQAISTTILGTQEQHLASSVLQLQELGQHGPPTHQGHCTSSSNSAAACSLHASQPIAAVLAALPFIFRVEWKPFGRWEFQGSAFMTLTNGCGVFLCMCIRSVALVRTGGKARGLSLSWPGRFGQAAKAGRAVPGQAEDLALQRRRQKRYGAAQCAVEYAAELRGELPEGSKLFSAVYTSALEGVQVAAAAARDKPAHAALLQLLLGLPAAWPEEVDTPAAGDDRRCKKCGELMKSRKQRGKNRGHRCRKARSAAAGHGSSWLAGSWWSSSQAMGGGYTRGSVLLAFGVVSAAAAVLYLSISRQRMRR